MSNKFKFLSLILLLSISTLSYSNRRENNGIIDTTPGGGGFGGGRDTDKYWYCGDTYVPRIGGISKSEACSANFNLRLNSNVDNKPIKPIYGNVENKPKYKVSIIPEDDTIFVRKIISEEDSTIISPGEVDLKPTRDNTTGSVTVSVNNNRYVDRDISTSIHEIPAPELGETQFLISAKRYEIHGSDLIGVEIDDESSERKLVYKLNDKKLKSELEGKLNKDLSNLADNSILESKLSEGVRDKLNSKLDKNLSNLTDHVIVKEKLSTEVIKEIEGKLNKDLSNINDKEKDTLRKNLDVYNKGEVDSKLETKLNKDLSNLSDNSILESKLSEGVRDKLNSKLDKNLSNLTDHVIVKEKLSTEVIKEIEGKLDKDLSNINDKEKENLRKNLDVYNKGEVDSKLETKLNKDLSNLADNSILESKLSEGVRDKLNNKVDKDGNNINVEKFIEKLNENSNISIPTGSLVKDSDVKNYLENNYTNNIELKKQLDKKLEKDLSNLNDKEKETLRKNLDVYNKGEVDSKLETKLNKDLSNLSDNSILESKLSEGVRDKLNSKLDKNLSNLTDHVIVKEKLSTEVIKEIEGKLNKDLSNINDKEKETLRKNLDVYNKGEVDTKLDGKLNKDLSNLSDNSILESKLSEGVRDKLNNKVDKDGNNINIEKFIEKLNENSNISIPTGSLVKDSDVKNYLENNYTNNIELKKQLDKKLEKDLSNINDNEKQNLRKNLDLYSKKEINDSLAVKANKDGSNIEVDKYISILSNGSNVQNPKNMLVTDKMLKEYISKNQGIVYDNVDKTELSLYNTTIHNVSDGINPTDAVNKRQLDSVASGVAVAIANSNLSTQKGHSIGIGVGYFKKEWGISLGYSGEINRFGFKVNSGLSSKLEFSAGLGLSYSFGKKEEPFVMKVDDNNLDIFVDRINNIEKNVKEKLEKYINEDKKGMERDIEKLKSENLNLKNEISKIYEILKDKKEVVSDVAVVDKFEFDKTDISEGNMKKIDEFLGKRKISVLNIIGYTDKVGTEQYNIDLSLRRAKSVKEYIKNKMLYGVINIFGKGEKEPISSNDEENRRVELIVEEE